MPKPRIYDSGPPLTVSKIEALEKRIGGKLPRSYRNFLLHHNGGSPDPEGFSSKQGRPSSILDIFFGLGIKDRFCDLRQQFRDSRKDMPAELLPIAHDLGGNLICLTFKGKNRGKLFFWDHEGAPEPVNFKEMFPDIIFNEDPNVPDETPDDWPGHPDLTLLADSFEEFLNSFTDDD